MSEYVSPKIARRLACYEQRAFYHLIKRKVMPAEMVDIPGSPVFYKIHLPTLMKFMEADSVRNKRNGLKLVDKAKQQEKNLQALKEKYGNA